jgi:hypothetical protein
MLTNGLSYAIQPTAKFYGEEVQRHVTVLEYDQASLPMRLTGDGVRCFLLVSIRQANAVEIAMANQIQKERGGITDSHGNAQTT